MNNHIIHSKKPLHASGAANIEATNTIKIISISDIIAIYLHYANNNFTNLIY